jgi:hypothetical protein
MKEFRHEFSVLKGRCLNAFSKIMGRYISQLEDGNYEVAIVPMEIKGSNDQLALLHVYFKIYSDDTGYTETDAKRHFKRMLDYFELGVNIETGEEELEYYSFKHASMKKRAEFIEIIYNYLNFDLGMNVPSAEQWKNLTQAQKNELKKTGFRYE